jgi:hypothetical protein
MEGAVARKTHKKKRLKEFVVIPIIERLVLGMNKRIS